MTPTTEPLTELLERIHCGDCIDGMNALPKHSVHLAFADPPFNIGYSYDVYDDRVDDDEYLKWSRDWMQAVHRVLTEDGTFWLAIGDEYAAELKIMAREAGFHMRSWVIWYYTFGVNCKNKFTRSHTHLLYFVKDPKRFTFRADDPENRVPSARQLVYNDRRANSRGRLPDDTWIIPPAVDQTFTLRPQDLEEQFQEHEDTWYFARVAGTFRERAGFHGCQMPEQLLGRIIRCCSHENDIVLDPFAGSASTLITARKLHRRTIGFELSPEYTEAGQQRLDAVRPGDPLNGAPEPSMAAKKTPRQPHRPSDQPAAAAENRPNDPDAGAVPAAGPAAGKTAIGSPPEAETSLQSAAADKDAVVPETQPSRRKKTARDRRRPVARRLKEILNETIVTAWQKIHEGWAVDRVLADPDLQAAFCEECARLGLPLSPRDACLRLLKLRKVGGALKGTRRYSVTAEECEPYLSASEIAWVRLRNGHPDRTIEDILADPDLARQFDATARQFAPGFRSLDYRWGALRLRKTLKKARSRGTDLNVPRRFWLGDRFSRCRPRDLPDRPGIYLVYRDDECIYVGSAACLASRLVDVTRKPDERWEGRRRQLSYRYFAVPEGQTDLLPWVSAVISSRPTVPQYNLAELHTGHAARGR